jgi:hypothetical protein
MIMITAVDLSEAKEFNDESSFDRCFGGIKGAGEVLGTTTNQQTNQSKMKIRKRKGKRGRM